MVTTRVTSKLANLHRKWFDDMLTGKNYSFGRSDVVLVTITKTTDPMGGVTGVTESESTINAEVQFVTKQDKQILEMGIADVGDAKLYVKGTTTVNVNKDEIEINSVRWRVTELVEAPEVDGVVCHQMFLLKRKFET